MFFDQPIRKPPTAKLFLHGRARDPHTQQVYTLHPTGRGGPRHGAARAGTLPLCVLASGCDCGCAQFCSPLRPVDPVCFAPAPHAHGWCRSCVHNMGGSVSSSDALLLHAGLALHLLVVLAAEALALNTDHYPAPSGVPAYDQSKTATVHSLTMRPASLLYCLPHTCSRVC